MTVCIISTYPPRMCGIAHFTYHLRKGIIAAGETSVPVIALVDEYDPKYDSEVIFQLKKDRDQDYTDTINILNSLRIDAVILQHEFSFFSGGLGSHVLHLLENIKKPIITTLHHVFPDYGMNLLTEIARLSQKSVTISANSREILLTYGAIDKNDVTVIPNGVPEYQTKHRWRLRRKLGLTGRTTALSCGLLSKNKGFELVLQAIPKIIKRHPKFLYVIAGKTHPYDLGVNGKSYYQSLVDLSQKLGISKHVRFVHEFLPDREMIEYMVAADMFICPYTNPNQNSSSTLNCAAFYQKPIISSSFLGAEELLEDDYGYLFPLGDGHALYEQLSYVLENSRERKKTAKFLGQKAKDFSWTEIGKNYLNVVQKLTNPVSSKVIYPRR